MIYLIQQCLKNTDNYIKFETLELTDENTYNLHDIRECRTFLTNNCLDAHLIIDKPYIVLKQIHGVYQFHKIVDTVISTYVKIIHIIKFI